MSWNQLPILSFLILSFFHQSVFAGKALTPSVINLQQNNPWYQQAKSANLKQDQRARIPPAPRGAAKNIILFIGDGMGVTTVTAARILDGQNKGMLGEDNSLSFDHFPHSALSKTYNVDMQTPDSAGTMTALVTGVKTDAGIIGLAENATRGQCSSSKGQNLFSILELAEMAGLSTGIVTTARVTHATPAATYAESVERDWESDSRMPYTARKAGCEDIASQLIHFSSRLNQQAHRNNINGIEVVLGGGRRNFLPQKTQLFQIAGNREDGRNLIQEWSELYPTGKYITNKSELLSLNGNATSQVLGLFHDSHLRYQSDRTNSEPSLAQMTQKAIEILKKNPKGFFLMVEGARIDHAHHAGNAYNALNETIEFSKSVDLALSLTDPKDTLIIVTADHSHVFTIAGYPKRGNPILGKVIEVGQTLPTKSAAGKPYTTLGYSNGLGFRDLGDETDANVVLGTKPVTHGDLSKVDTTKPGYHQEVTIPLSNETHGAEDVAIYGNGPGSHLVDGTLEQNQVFHIMEFAGDLMKKALDGFQSQKTL